MDDSEKFFSEARRTLKKNGILIVGDPLFPAVARKVFEWFISPFMKSGDNKLFSHRKLQSMFLSNGFEISEAYKKGKVQIISGKKL
jgi:SAM-dependent methyltransferase